MIKLHKLQTRLFVAFAGLSMLVCLLFIRLSTLFISTAEFNAYQAMLKHAQVNISEQQLANIPTILEASFIEFYQQEKDIPTAYQEQMAGQLWGDFTVLDNEYVFRLFNHQGQQVALFINTTELSANQQLTQYKDLLLYSISISVVLLSLFSSWYLAKWLSKPVELLTLDVKRNSRFTLQTQLKTQQQANPQISHQTSHGRENTNINKECKQQFSGLSRQDEIGELAQALTTSYTQIQTLLQREHNFTRDVSHELRTPITLIKNAMALRSNEQLTTQTTEVITDAVRELEQTVEILLALARQENLTFSQQKLLPIIEKTILNILYSHPTSQFDVALTVPHTLEAKGNPHLIALLFQNLVNNSFYHSGEQSLTITSQDRQLAFENPMRSQENQMNYQHKGLGHGIYLCQRIATEMGWSLTSASSASHYRVIISLPKA